VNSALLANNENKNALDNASVIDVYNISDGKYQCSFYIPDFNKHKITDFIVSGKTIIALYDHFINTYRLNI